MIYWPIVILRKTNKDHAEPWVFPTAAAINSGASLFRFRRVPFSINGTAVRLSVIIFRQLNVRKFMDERGLPVRASPEWSALRTPVYTLTEAGTITIEPIWDRNVGGRGPPRPAAGTPTRGERSVWRSPINHLFRVLKRSYARVHDE